MRPPVALKSLSLALIVFLLLSGVPVLAAPPAPAAPAGSRAALARLESEAGGEVQVSVKRGLNTASFVNLPRSGSELALSGVTLRQQAMSFLSEYGELFGIRDARQELADRPTLRDLAGGSHVRFAQIYQGIPVFGGELRVHFDKGGRVVAANGAFVPDIDTSVTPVLTPEQAAQAATLAVAAANPEATSTAYTAEAPELLIYRTGLVQGVEGQSYLAYRVEVSNGVDVRDQTFIDATTGKVLDRFPMMDNALYRELYLRSYSPRSLVWKEGDAWPADTEYQNVLNGAGETYNLIGSLTNGGWLSYNGADAVMKSIAKYNPGGLYCPNASWNGTNTQFCNEVSGDDTVAHEWGHAYTEYTHNLIYAWQPGALNEAYSDIWGEVVDLLNARGKDDATPALRSADGLACSALACDSNAPATDNSWRWVSGEDDPGFGCPIRDMWRPDCYGDPGSVTSTNYYCSSSDGGGVHTNSGVPNHGFALTVDGGTSGGQTIAGLGLVKAAHIYWHAQSTYQTNVTDFADHADALAASCQDLIGQPLYDLKTTGPGAWGSTTPALTQSDCDQVNKVALAVQFRTAPACTFTPMFNPNALALCTNAGDSPQNYLFEGFEAGMTGWTTQQAPSNASTWTDRPWHVVGNAPDGHAGSAVFGPDPVVGDCGADLENGVTSLLSPEISIPTNATAPVKMAWDHLVSMEIDYDGGNLKASVNGGAFALVPASAFTFNPYNSSLAAGDNDNPMAGQAAWTGGDGGAVSSKWGQSQIDLSKIGVDPGDKVQFRWDVGSDGCNGWDGWYLDDVRVYSCSPCAAPDAPTGLGIAAPDAATISLSWSAAAGASQYEVWTAENAPYFDVTGKTCASPAPYQCAVRTGTTYGAADLGSPAVNHSYTVRSASSCGQTAGGATRVGEFEFSLVKGQ